MVKNIKKILNELMFESDVNSTDISTWFLEEVTEKLKQLQKQEEDDILKEKIREMIFFFNEANRSTSSKQNSYQNTCDMLSRKVRNRYGDDFSLAGDEKLDIIGYGADINEYLHIYKEFQKEEKELQKYRNKQLQEGLKLFKQYFWKLHS